MIPESWTRRSQRHAERRARLVPLLLILALAPASCRSFYPQDSPFRAEGATITLEVENRDFSDVTLYALPGRDGPSVMRRIGTVLGNSSEAYSISGDLAGALRIRITTAAGANCVTQPLDVRPGDTLKLVIDLDFYGRHCQ